MSKEILEDALRLPSVSAEAILAYEQNQEAMLEEVMQALNEQPMIQHFLGGNSIKILKMMWEKHALSMLTIFRFGDFRILARRLPGAYRYYLSQGINPALIHMGLQAWKEAVSNNLPLHEAHSILEVYTWIEEHHHYWLELSGTNEASVPLFGDEKWDFVRNSFIDQLLQGAYFDCLQLAEDSITTTNDLWSFYTTVLYPTLTHIISLAGKGCISLAQRQLAIAIMERVIASLYLVFPRSEPLKQKVLVVPITDPSQRVDARITADLLHLDGWDVELTGVELRLDELVAVTRKLEPFILGISISHIDGISIGQQFVEVVRQEPKLDRVLIMLSGSVLQGHPYLGRKLGVDGLAYDAVSAVELANRWWS